MITRAGHRSGLISQHVPAAAMSSGHRIGTGAALKPGSTTGRAAVTAAARQRAGVSQNRTAAIPLRFDVGDP